MDRRALLLGALAPWPLPDARPRRSSGPQSHRLRDPRATRCTLIVNTGREGASPHPGRRGLAMRYPVAVGKEGHDWAGIAEVGRKVKWPVWTPPAAMIARKPELARWAEGMPGGPENPLGARALYLYANGRDTLFRIHGTNEPDSIGQGGVLRLHPHAQRAHRGNLRADAARHQGHRAVNHSRRCVLRSEHLLNTNVPLNVIAGESKL